MGKGLREFSLPSSVAKRTVGSESLVEVDMICRYSKPLSSNAVERYWERKLNITDDVANGSDISPLPLGLVLLLHSQTRISAVSRGILDYTSEVTIDSAKTELKRGKEQRKGRWQKRNGMLGMTSLGARQHYNIVAAPLFKKRRKGSA